MEEFYHNRRIKIGKIRLLLDYPRKAKIKVSMKRLTPKEFVEKWSKIELKESSTAQTHFNDLCQLIGHPIPLEVDPKGEFFTFEFKTKKLSGDDGLITMPPGICR